MNSIHEEYIRQLQQALAACDGEKLERLYALIDAARSQGRQIFVLGNGGSAATSSHWACDFGKGASVAGARRVRMFAPCDNVATLTAYGNDVSYDSVFVEQLKNLLERTIS